MVPLHEGKRYLPFLDPLEVRGSETQEFENLSSDSASSSSDSSEASSSSESSSVPRTMIISDETSEMQPSEPEAQPDVPGAEDLEETSEPPPVEEPQQTGDDENMTSGGPPGQDTNLDNENL